MFRVAAGFQPIHTSEGDASTRYTPDPSFGPSSLRFGSSSIYSQGSLCISESFRSGIVSVPGRALQAQISFSNITRSVNGYTGSHVAIDTQKV